MYYRLTSIAMQPFGSQPATSFVFWLKAHNKPGQPPVYTVAQIVCFFHIFLRAEKLDWLLGFFIERVSNSWQCIYCCILSSGSLGLWWTPERAPLAGYHLWKHCRDSNFRLTCCDSRIWSFLSSSTSLYFVLDWRKCCPLDHGVSLPFSLSIFTRDAMTNIIYNYNRWMAELISDNAEQRAFTAAAMNTLQCKLLFFSSPTSHMLTAWW